MLLRVAGGARVSQDAADRFWEYVMGKTYREIPQSADLTDIEIAGLRDVRRTDQTEPVRLNYGFGLRPLTVTAALEWAERLAREELA